MAHSKQKKTGFLDRTVASFQHYTKKNFTIAWQNIAGTARAISGTINPDLPAMDQERLLKKMQDCLNPKGGELTARRNTIDLGGTYLNLSDKGKKAFLTILASSFDIDREQLAHKIKQVQSANTLEQSLSAERELRDVLRSPRMRILRQFNGLPEGIKFLVDMRADLLKCIGKTTSELTPLEEDLRTLLSAWFDIGLLEMQEITWNSPASLLEKLIAYEAVHEISSWADLKNRLDSDRRCFAFFHPKMPDEPLIFVEVALVKGMADNIQVLLDESLPSIDPKDVDTAIFYSISNAQAGLAGISFGNFLIKRVVDSLSREFPHIKTFATLSPIPGFTKWLDGKLTGKDETLLTPAEAKALVRSTTSKDANKSLQELLHSKWADDAKHRELLESILKRLCALYLLKEKRGALALDPVANFHLTNGARVERINWLADTSKKGLQQSHGLMVNYLYQLAKIDDNHESYLSARSIAASSQVKSLV